MYKKLVLALGLLISTYGCFSLEAMELLEGRGAFQPLTELLREQSNLPEARISELDARAEAICMAMRNRPHNADYSDLQTQFTALIDEIADLLG